MCAWCLVWSFAVLNASLNNFTNSLLIFFLHLMPRLFLYLSPPIHGLANVITSLGTSGPIQGESRNEQV